MTKLLAIVLLAGLTGCVTAEQRLAQDDNYCKSIGLPYGSRDYAACRIMRTNAHDAQAQQAREAMLLTGLTLMNR